MRSRTPALRCFVAVLVVATLGFLAAPFAAPARAADALSAPVPAAAGWTVAQLTDGTHASGGFGPDHGLTADVVLGLAATGVADATTRASAGWLAGHARAYIDGGYAGDVSAGAVAKLALIARAVGAEPTAFGGLDLRRTLLGRLQSSGRFTDRLTDGAQVLDLSNVFTQALGVLALRAGTDAPATAVEFLARQRCADGGFPVFYPQRPADCLSDADGTGVAVQALLAVGRAADAEPAVAWLVGHQAPDGSFRNSGPGAAPNSNSTALAAQALRPAGRTAQADAAVSWLKTRQVGCAAPAGDRGAIGYQEPVADASALRATAQALPALAGVALADSDDLVGTGPDEVPVALCTAPTATTTTATATTSTTTTATTTAAAASSLSGTSSPGTQDRVAVTAPRSTTPSGRSTPAPTPSTGAAATTPAEPPSASETAPLLEPAEDSLTEPMSEPSALAAASAQDGGGTGAPGIPWWVGVAAVLVAGAGWLAATGRLSALTVGSAAR